LFRRFFSGAFVLVFVFIHPVLRSDRLFGSYSAALLLTKPAGSPSARPPFHGFFAKRKAYRKPAAANDITNRGGEFKTSP
jgi:hypothetical protein